MPKTERQKDQQRRANRARYAAIKLLVSLYPREYEQLYEQQAKLEGVTPAPRRGVSEVEALRFKLAELQEQLEEAQGWGTDSWPTPPLELVDTDHNGEQPARRLPRHRGTPGSGAHR